MSLSIVTKEDFAEVTGGIRAQPHFREPILWAIGKQVWTGGPTPVLASARFPVVNGPTQGGGFHAIICHVLGLGVNTSQRDVETHELNLNQIERIKKCLNPFLGDILTTHPNLQMLVRLMRAHARTGIVFTAIYDVNAPSEGVADATLRLYGLSLRHFEPRQLNLNGIFGVLPNITWIGDTPIDADEVDEALMEAAINDKSYAPDRSDKFPLYMHRINAIKMGVRIGDDSTVRLGAYLGEGVTLYGSRASVNFNGGAMGPAMIEGAVSSSVQIGKGTDIGGGASIQGTLSGGNKTPISIGNFCLLGANSCLGIPIGNCVVLQAGVSVMPGMLVDVFVEGHELNGQTVKARELVGVNGVTFRQNSETGKLEVVTTPMNRQLAEKGGILNADLHATSTSPPKP